MSNSFFREDAQAGIFEPFGRLHERPLHIEGAGIGLSICRQLMELMDGTIGVSSEPGSGSTFWIRVKGADGRPEPSLDNTRPHRADREQLVLYVEDSPSHVRLVHHIIDLMGDVRLVADPDGPVVDGEDAFAGAIRGRLESLGKKVHFLDVWDCLHTTKGA